MSKRLASYNLNLEFTLLRAGQLRPHQDAENVVLINNRSSESVPDKIIEQTINLTMEYHFPKRRGTPIDSKETLKKTNTHTWVWEQKVPYTD